MTYAELVKKLDSVTSRIAEIDDAPEMTDELKAEQDSLIAEQENLQGKISRKRKQIEAGNFLEEAKANPPVEKRVTATAEIASEAPNIANPMKIPATAKRFCGNLKSFKGADADVKAYRFGQFFMATAGVRSAIDYCNNSGLIMAVHNEGSNTAGGYLVPEEFSTDLIRLVLDYGVFRANTNVTPMISDTKTFPRRTSGITAYWVGESSSTTESDIAWDQVRLVAKKLSAITRVTNELNADAAISVGDQVMQEIALAFAYAEDNAGFNGDGTSTYGGIVGARQALNDAAGNPTTTSAGGIIIGAGNAYSELTLANLHSVVALCPTYARANAKWYVSPLFHETVMASLQTAAGGNTVVDIANGGLPRCLGYPVVLTEVMPTTAANSQVCALFGDLARASKLGDRQMMTIKTSDSATVDGDNVFELDQLAIKGVERLDINVHDVGSTSAAGPLVGLQTLNA